MRKLTTPEDPLRLAVLDVRKTMNAAVSVAVLVSCSEELYVSIYVHFCLLESQTSSPPAGSLGRDYLPGLLGQRIYLRPVAL